MKFFLSVRDAAVALCDLFLPRTCISCGRELGVHERHLCLYCRADIPLTYNWERTHHRMADRFNERIQEGLEVPSAEPHCLPSAGQSPSQSPHPIADLVEGERQDPKDPSVLPAATAHSDKVASFIVKTAEDLSGEGMERVPTEPLLSDETDFYAADSMEGPSEEGRGRSPKEPYAYAACLFRYSSDSGFKEIPQSLKYRYNRSGGRYFARMLGRYLASSDHFADVDLVIPVPLHFFRRWKRGYNQAEIIAREVAIALDAPLSTNLLYRRRYTRTQTKTSVSSKGRNVSGAFALHPRALRRLLSVSSPLSSTGCSTGSSTSVPLSSGSSSSGCSAGSSSSSGCSAVSSTAGSPAVSPTVVGSSVVDPFVEGFSPDRSSAADSSTESVRFPHHILLIDDVFTTGATLYACFSALRTAFPSPIRISIATLAALER